MEELAGRTAVVTGVGHAGQVGEAVARALASAGARVITLSRTVDEARAREAELRAERLDVTGFAADLADASAVAAAVREMRARIGDRVHALVCAAGGFAASGPVADSDLAVLEHQFRINLVTAFVATRAFVPMLRGGGSIVYFASAAALPDASPARVSAYAAAKSGVLALMRAVAAEERTNSVRANAVAPSSIRTASNVAAMGEDARYVEMDEVTRTVAFLCGDGASAITGQVIRLG